MEFHDLMGAMHWAAQETDEIRATITNDAHPFVSGHQKFGEAVAWLQDNRALIEAAPELLISLEDLLACPRGGDTHQMEQQEINRRHKQARAAIAKAKGEI